MGELDGSIRIAWQADGFEVIHVHAPRRDRSELDGFARDVADAALFNRSVADLRVALRLAYDGDVSVVERTAPGATTLLVVTLHPPPGVPNPDE